MTEAPPTSPEPAAQPGRIPGVGAPASAAGTVGGDTPAGTPPRVIGRDGYPVAPPDSLAKALLASTAAYGLITVAAAAFAARDAQVIREIFESGEFAFTAGMILQVLSLFVMLMSFIAYGLWMGRMRHGRTALGHDVGLPAVEWWGWFVPIASVFLVPSGARRIMGRSVSLAVVLGWWITWCVAQTIGGIAGVLPNLALDLETGTLARPEYLDLYAPLMWVSTAFTVVSWVFMATMIRRATPGHLTKG